MWNDCNPWQFISARISGVWANTDKTKDFQFFKHCVTCLETGLVPSFSIYFLPALETITTSSQYLWTRKAQALAKRKLINNFFMQGFLEKQTQVEWKRSSKFFLIYIWCIFFKWIWFPLSNQYELFCTIDMEHPASDDCWTHCRSGQIVQSLGSIVMGGIIGEKLLMLQLLLLHCLCTGVLCVLVWWFSNFSMVTLQWKNAFYLGT